jgi:hypothetical protein
MMIMILSRKVFWMLALPVLLCCVVAGQTPPDQRSLPQLPQPPTLLLDVDFKINGGASTTKQRSVRVNFTAREKSDPGDVTIRDATASVTHYRVVESDDLLPDKLSAQTWISIAKRPAVFDLALRNGKRERYGERRVMLQVKTDTLTSNIASDTIVLEPVLKDYRISPRGTNHPLIQYAADQGFTFPRDYYEGCKGGNCPAPGSENIANGSANISLQGLIGACRAL